MRRKRQLDIDSEVLTELYELEFESEVNRSSREYIKWIQSSLNKILGFRLKVDGFIGPKTRSAIRSFQLRNNLKADGIVGPKTEAALLRAGALQPPGNNSQAPSPVIPPPIISPTPGIGTPVISRLRNNLVTVANLQWNAWGNGSKKEYDAGMDRTIKRYWEEGVGISFPGVSTAWSAAFISWVVKEAGGGANFKYSGAHTTYTYNAKQNRIQNNSNPFKAYRITEKKPEPGDIIVQNRRSSKTPNCPPSLPLFTYEDFKPDTACTHGDIVVNVNATSIDVIGGNVRDTVKKESYQLNSSGFLNSTMHFAIIKIEEPSVQNEWEDEYELLSEFTFEAPVAAPPAKTFVDPKKVTCANTNRTYPIFRAIGTKDPVGSLEAICKRAVEMMTNTISELTRVKGRVSAGDPIGFPLLGDLFAWSLEHRMKMKVNDRAAWTGTGPRNAEIIIRWLTRIRDLIAGRELWFTCLESAGCNSTTWAWVFTNNSANRALGRNMHRIHLCRRFWQPKPGVSAATHFEFQAQTIIHEASHIYYDTEDQGRGPGAAECISQFIAETNNSPLDPDFIKRCGGPSPS